MRLTGFRVTKYRNVEDSGWVSLDDNTLTCIVGKNQSGKTALLKALHRFNPDATEPGYNLQRQWPRGHRRARDTKQVVTEVEFALSADEAEALSAFTEGGIRPTSVRVTKNYAGEFEVSFPEKPDLFPDLLHPNAVDQACSKLPAVPETVGKNFAETLEQQVASIRRIAREGRYSDLADNGQEALVAALGSERVPNNPGHEATFQAEEQAIGKYRSALKAVVKTLDDLPTMHAQAHEYVVQHLPTFIYMDDYREFSGTAQLDDLLTRSKKGKTTEEDDTLLMTLKLAGLDLATLVQQGQETDPEVIRDRQYDLDDASKTLTNDVAGRWGQQPYRVRLNADGQKFFVEIEETDKNVGMIPLEEQSKGFRWFFSFDLRFMHDSGGTFKGCVVLLDEPGLHLHPGGQGDLLRRLDAYSRDNTLIYTTHLPFLVDLRDPDRIRVITQTEAGATVSGDLSSTQPEEKLTLQAALGMKLDQSYLIASRNLVVEGAHDYWLLTALSNLFERSGEDALPPDVKITAAGGAADEVPLSTFMVGQDLQVVALFDSDEQGRTAEKRLREKWLTKYKEHKSGTLLLGDAVGQKGDFEVEDLFGPEFYVERVRRTHEKKGMAAGTDVAAITTSGSGTLADRVARSCHTLGIAFNKGSAAKAIRSDLVKMKALSELDQPTVGMVRKLFAAIREQFGGEGPPQD